MKFILHLTIDVSNQYNLLEELWNVKNRVYRGQPVP